jgi:phospholipase C
MPDTTLCDCSREKLPNSVQNDRSNVPRDIPAIGDLFHLFDFDHHDDGHHEGGDHDR